MEKDVIFCFCRPTNSEKEMATHSSLLAWRILWTEGPGGLLSMGLHRVSSVQDWIDWIDLACMHTLEKEMATRSSILAWRIPRTEEPGGLPSMGSHKVGHDWSNLAVAATDPRITRTPTHPISLGCNAGPVCSLSQATGRRGPSLSSPKPPYHTAVISEPKKTTGL